MLKLEIDGRFLQKLSVIPSPLPIVKTNTRNAYLHIWLPFLTIASFKVQAPLVTIDEFAVIAFFLMALLSS